MNLVVLAALLQLGSIVCRGLATDRWPLGNMYEFTSAVCLAAVVTWLVVLRRLPALRAVALFVLLPVVILLFLAGTVLYARAAPVVPALRSYWLVVHVTTITISSGLLLVPGVASLLFLLRRSGRGGALVERLPSAAALDRLAYRTTIVAFPLYTFGVIAGAIWAEAAWGRFWGWDPKETVAFVAWVVYAAYLHARATAGWRSGRAAWINVAGLAVVLFNLFFINMVVAGLHSYAGSDDGWPPSLAVRDPAPRPASRPSGTTRLPSDSVGKQCVVRGGPVVTQGEPDPEHPDGSVGRYVREQWSTDATARRSRRRPSSTLSPPPTTPRHATPAAGLEVVPPEAAARRGRPRRPSSETERAPGRTSSPDGAGAATPELPRTGPADAGLRRARSGPSGRDASARLAETPPDAQRPIRATRRPALGRRRPAPDPADPAARRRPLGRPRRRGRPGGAAGPQRPGELRLRGAGSISRRTCRRPGCCARRSARRSPAGGGWCTCCPAG